ncbi:ABC transporter permease [Candidatus Zixiibacteriota bacterium]
MNLLRIAIRSLTRTPMVVLVVVFSLGLGIGSNTAIFSLVYQILLRPLPVPQPEELVLATTPGDLKSGRSSNNDAGGMDYIFSYPAFRELEASAAGTIELAGFRSLGANLATDSGTVSGSMLMVSGSYFSALRIQPHLGRLIMPNDDIPGEGNPAVVISYGFWSDQLGADPAVVNSTLRVNSHSFTIIGIAPQGFTGLTLGNTPDVYVPLDFKPLMTPGWDGTDRYDDYWLYLFGRLAPGVSPEQAETALNGPYSGIVGEMDTAGMGLTEEEVIQFRQSQLSLEPGLRGNSGFREGALEPLIILMAATILVLLIAMANATNLLLTRSAMRRRELGIRVALGAGRRHLMIQLLTEALVLAVAGGIVGLLLGSWTLSLIVSWIAEGETAIYFLTTQLQLPVLLFSLGAVTVVGLLLGLYPAWEASRRDVVASLGDGSTKSSAGRGSARVRRILVGGQVAISVLLLFPTGLFTKSLSNLLNVDLGMSTENMITFRVSPDLNGYSQEQISQLYNRMVEELEAIPGVSMATPSMIPLISGSNWGSTVSVEDFEGGPDSDSFSNWNSVGPGFFADMGIALLTGREFTISDGSEAPQVAIVNQAFADHFMGGENPVGKRMTQGWGENIELDIEIVGLVQDTKYSDVKQEPRRIFYLPWRQLGLVNDMSFFVGSALPAEQTIQELRHVMATIDPNLPLENLRTMDDQVRDNIMADRIVMQLSALFALLATILAMMGLYGVMAHSVTQRIREIGIRMALGADSRSIRSMVMNDLFRLLMIGLLVGIPAALGLAKLAESQLFGVTAFNLMVLVATVVVLALAALLAGLLPAGRATRVDPVISLRQE